MPGEQSYTITINSETLYLPVPVYSKPHLLFTFVRANGSKAPKCIAWNGQDLICIASRSVSELGHHTIRIIATD